MIDDNKRVVLSFSVPRWLAFQMLASAKEEGDGTLSSLIKRLYLDDMAAKNKTIAMTKED